MSEYYTDYIWKNGSPYGTGKQPTPQGTYYKVVADPYRKRIAIEAYENDSFCRIIYDSALLDFRHLRPPAEQTAWQKTIISTTPQATISHIRNQEDRLICIETCLFDNERCIECHLSSPHGLHLSTHRMFYKNLNAPFNGVILYDSNEHPVMMKKYDSSNNEFTNLLEESWDLGNGGTTP